MPTPGTAPTPIRPRVILHGKRAEDPEFRSAVERLREEGHEIDVRATWEAGDGVELAREAVAAGVPRLIAAGGDGTVHEVALGLLEAGEEASDRVLPSMGIVPLGTGNDLATAAGISEDPYESLKLALLSPARWVDACRANDARFLNMATGGFGTEVTTSTPDELKDVLGRIAYLLTGLAHMTAVQPVEARISAPDFEWSGPLLVLAVGNGRMAGGGRRLCPDALIDDGALDVRIVPDVEAGQFGSRLRALMQGGLPALDSDVPGARAPWVEVEAPDGLHVNLDGEPTFGTHFRFEVEPERLQLHLPEDSELIGG